MRLALAFIVSLLVACGAAEQAPAAASPAAATGDAPAAAAPSPVAAVADVDSAELKKRMDAGSVVVVDVRTKSEYTSGHVPGALHIPLAELESRISELEQYEDQDLYLICAVGGRSAKAKGLLTKKGFDRAINVVDGTNGWRAAGFPVE